ncbi:MAG: hypothetical protein KF814_05260 [Nitrospiraceae bacterium]|nr:hypothetical protein [Nitrospiraceae bacterium]
MLCCTVDNNTNQVINCRKPAGSHIMPGLQGNNIGAAGMAGVQRRGTAGTATASDEDTPVPSTLTPELVKDLVKKPTSK